MMNSEIILEIIHMMWTYIMNMNVNIYIYIPRKDSEVDPEKDGASAEVVGVIVNIKKSVIMTVHYDDMNVYFNNIYNYIFISIDAQNYLTKIPK